MSLPDAPNGTRGSNLHASAVLIGEAGVLIRGPAGSGKSSLVLQLLDHERETAWLVSDDQVIVAAHHGRLVADTPATIAGQLEIRGQGIITRPHVAPVVIGLVVELRPADECPRMPEDDERTVTIDGVPVAALRLPIGGCDGAARVRAFLSNKSL